MNATRLKTRLINACKVVIAAEEELTQILAGGTAGEMTALEQTCICTCFLQRIKSL